MTFTPGPPVAFADLRGWDAGAGLAAWSAFRRSSMATAEQRIPLRPAGAAIEGLAEIQACALSLGVDLSDADARSFFRDHFVAHTVVERDAFFTGYYEPVVEGALTRGEGFDAPLLARPADLVTLAADDPRPSWEHDLAALRRCPDGTVEPYPTRATIEAGVDAGGFCPVVWLRDWTEVFLVQVQGSARVRVRDGPMLRITYAGRNGHPYTSIGRILVDSGEIAAESMSLDRLKAWIRENGQAGRALMQRNASYIFYDATPDVSETGPIGGAGVPLTPLASIAIDRSHWCYGLPFWVDVDLPSPGAATPMPFQRLMIAQDTGSAIVGPARVDLFVGSGEAAGQRAGGIRHFGRLAVLLPKRSSAPP